MKSSSFSANERVILVIVAVLTSINLLFLSIFDAYKYIDPESLRNFSLSKNNLISLVLGTFSILAIIFWFLSVSKKHFGYAAAFLFFLSLLVAATTYLSGISYTTDDPVKPLVIVFFSLLFIESIARLQQSGKKNELEKRVNDKSAAMKNDYFLNSYLSRLNNIETLDISKIYHGSNFLKLFKVWLAPSFILLSFIFFLAIILIVPDYIISNSDLPNFPSLKFYLATFLILVLLAGIAILNVIVKKVYGYIVMSELRKRAELANLYDRYIKNEKRKAKKLRAEIAKHKSDFFNLAAYITILSLVIAIASINLDTNQAYDTTMQFFITSPGYQEHTILNEINQIIRDSGDYINNLEFDLSYINDMITDWS